MTISAHEKLRAQRGFVPTTALAKSVTFDELMMHVQLTDGRTIGVPLVWFPLLRDSTPEQRLLFTIGGGGVSLHWPNLDEYISIAGLMAGVDAQFSRTACLARFLADFSGDFHVRR